MAAINATSTPSACNNVRRAHDAEHSSGVVCSSQLDSLLVDGTFVRTNIAPPKKEPKIVWTNTLTTTAWVDLNLTIPTTRSVYDGVHAIWNHRDALHARTLAQNRIKIGIGFLVSSNVTYGKARIRCIDCSCACENECEFDTHRDSSATVTAFKVLYTNATGQCTLRVVVDDPVKTHVLLQKAIVGLNDFRTHWLHGPR